MDSSAEDFDSNASQVGPGLDSLENIQGSNGENKMEKTSLGQLLGEVIYLEDLDGDYSLSTENEQGRNQESLQLDDKELFHVNAGIYQDPIINLDMFHRDDMFNVNEQSDLQTFEKSKSIPEGFVTEEGAVDSERVPDDPSANGGPKKWLEEGIPDGNNNSNSTDPNSVPSGQPLPRPDGDRFHQHPLPISFFRKSLWKRFPLNFAHKWKQFNEGKEGQMVMGEENDDDLASSGNEGTMRKVLKRPFRCLLCSSSFKLESSYKKHMTLKHLKQCEAMTVKNKGSRNIGGVSDPDMFFVNASKTSPQKISTSKKNPEGKRRLSKQK